MQTHKKHLPTLNLTTRLCLSLMPFILACSDSGGDEIDQNSEINDSLKSQYQAFPTLPTAIDNQVVLIGAMTWWFWEGDGGCFAVISDGRQNVELHSEAERCELIEYDENQRAKVAVIYDADKQYATGGSAMYSVVEFLE